MYVCLCFVRSLWWVVGGLGCSSCCAVDSVFLALFLAFAVLCSCYPFSDPSGGLLVALAPSLMPRVVAFIVCYVVFDVLRCCFVVPFYCISYIYGWCAICAMTSDRIYSFILMFIDLWDPCVGLLVALAALPYIYWGYNETKYQFPSPATRYALYSNSPILTVYRCCNHDISYY